MRDKNESVALSRRLDRHFLATAGVAAAVGISGTGATAEAGVVYSGLQNVHVPGDTSGGIYINLATSVVDPNPANVPGWDVNPYVGQVSGRFRFFNATGTSEVSGGTLAGEENIAKLAIGTLIDSSSTYTTDGFPLLATPNNAGAIWDGASSGDFLGVQFTEAGINGGNPLFGWMRISKLAGTPPLGEPNSTHITIVDWAYEDSGGGILAGAGIPEPSSLSLLAMGAVGLLARRGKVALRRSA